jgi:hypothetical protein
MVPETVPPGVVETAHTVAGVYENGVVRTVIGQSGSQDGAYIGTDGWVQ